jgi:transcriptional regulator with XRE-family HTH domain
VPKRTLEGWEQGRREPKLAMLVQLARVLGVTTDALLEGLPAEVRPSRQKGKGTSKGTIRSKRR